MSRFIASSRATLLTCLFALAASAVSASESRVVIGPSNLALADGSAALMAGDAEKELTVLTHLLAEADTALGYLREHREVSLVVTDLMLPGRRCRG